MTERLQELVELALKKELTKETRTELVKELFINNEGDIDLSELQLRNFEGNLLQHAHIVKRNLAQGKQYVGGHLDQSFQKVRGHLDQGNSLIDANLHQSGHTVKGSLYQNYQTVYGDLCQNSHTVKGYAILGNNNFAGIKELIYDLQKPSSMRWDLKTTKEIEENND